MNLFNLDLIELMMDKNKIEIKNHPLTAIGSEQDRHRMIAMSSANLNSLEILLHHRKHTAMQLIHCKDEDLRKLLTEMLKMIEQEIKKALILE